MNEEFFTGMVFMMMFFGIYLVVVQHFKKSETLNYWHIALGCIIGLAMGAILKLPIFSLILESMIGGLFGYITDRIAARHIGEKWSYGGMNKRKLYQPSTTSSPKKSTRSSPKSSSSTSFSGGKFSGGGGSGSW